MLRFVKADLKNGQQPVDYTIVDDTTSAHQLHDSELVVGDTVKKASINVRMGQARGIYISMHAFFVKGASNLLTCLLLKVYLLMFYYLVLNFCYFLVQLFSICNVSITLLFSKVVLLVETT